MPGAGTAIRNRRLVTRHKLVRAYLRVTREPLYKAVADYWPWISVGSAIGGRRAVRFRGREVCETRSFADLVCPAEVAIVGSGPSVLDMDMGRLASCACVLLNGAVSLVDSSGVDPLAVVVIDSTFVVNRLDMLRSLPRGTSLVVTPGVLRAMAERDLSLPSRFDIYLTQDIGAPAYDRDTGVALARAHALMAGFSSDLDLGFVNGGTVMATALQLVYQQGVPTTYLVGFDIGNAHQPRFYETPGNALKTGLPAAYELMILPFMEAAAEVFRGSGRALYNCSSVTTLPYDIVPYSSAFARSGLPTA